MCVCVFVQFSKALLTMPYCLHWGEDGSPWNHSSCVGMRDSDWHSSWCEALVTPLRDAID